MGSDNYDPTGRALADYRSTEGFWWTMISHNARMIKHNANILAPHPWQSTWWEWLIDARGVSGRALWQTVCFRCRGDG